MPEPVLSPKILMEEHRAGLHHGRPRFGCPTCSEDAHPPEPEVNIFTTEDVNNLRRLMELTATNAQECLDLLDEILEGK